MDGRNRDMVLMKMIKAYQSQYLFKYIPTDKAWEVKKWFHLALIIKILKKDYTVVDTDISKLKDKVKIQKSIRKFLNDHFQSACLKNIKFESTFS
jgi:hypothetical protein